MSTEGERGRLPDTREHGWQTFSVKDQVGNILDFVGHEVPTLPPCHSNMENNGVPLF